MARECTKFCPISHLWEGEVQGSTCNPRVQWPQARHKGKNTHGKHSGKKLANEVSVNLKQWRNTKDTVSSFWDVSLCFLETGLCITIPKDKLVLQAQGGKIGDRKKDPTLGWSILYIRF